MFRQNGKIHVGYKDLMENYQIVVSNLAAERGEKDTNLVLNVFQSLLDEFTRSYTKTDFEPTKVGGFTSPSPTPSGSSRCSSWLCLPPSSWPSSSRLVARIPLWPCPPPGPAPSAQPHRRWHHHLPGQPWPQCCSVEQAVGGRVPSVTR